MLPLRVSILLLLLVLPACGSSAAPSGDAGSPSDVSTPDAGRDGATDASFSDGTSDVTPGGPNWSCLGTVQPTVAHAATVGVTVNVSDVLLMSPRAGVLVKACARADVPCAAPVAMGTSDMDGNVTLTLPLGSSGFAGYFDLSGGDLVPSRNYVNPPIVEMQSRAAAVFLTQTDRDFVAMMAGVTLDPTRGVLLSQVLDCDRTRAAGATLQASSADARSTPYYVVGVTPTTHATVTDDVGAGGVFNLPVGPSTVTGRISPSRAIGSVGVDIVAGGFTYVDMVPGP